MAYEAKNLNVKTALMKKLSGTRDKRTSEVENGKTHLLDESPGPSKRSACLNNLPLTPQRA